MLRLARDTWRGLEAFTDREHHVPVDNVRLGEHSVDRADARVGDYTNVTSIGVHLIAIVAAEALGLASPGEAEARAVAVLDTLESLERHDGFFFNYYDTTTLERTSNLISFVDSSWLTAALMVVRTRSQPRTRAAPDSSTRPTIATSTTSRSGAYRTASGSARRAPRYPTASTPSRGSGA
jgi:hypothetical protein